MPGILADNDVGGHFEVLLQCFRNETWREIWASLRLTVHSFESLDLSREVSDAVLWHACQQQQIILVTGNRNDESSDSLESTIRSHNTPSSLPVFTLANATRISSDKPYAERVAERLLEYLFDIDRYRGTGRMFIP